MQELTKIPRVLGKQIPEAPHEVLLVLDATTGQNGIRPGTALHRRRALHGTRAREAPTARPKAASSWRFANKVGLPVKYVGVGEAADDLTLFESEPFVDAMFDDIA